MLIDNRTIALKAIERRILDLSFKHHLSHIGSCLTSLEAILDMHMDCMDGEGRFVLSCGHAGLALYCVLEYLYQDVNAEDLLLKCGVHPDRRQSEYIHCSTGSLGQGLPIALGMAMADKDRPVYCLISDGEATEGSIYEAMQIRSRLSVDNLHVACNWNGYGAYHVTHKWQMENLPYIKVLDTSQHWFIKMFGQEAHYRVLTQKDYEKILRRDRKSVV